jgi:hypothetical protein
VRRASRTRMMMIITNIWESGILGLGLGYWFLSLALKLRLLIPWVLLWGAHMCKGKERI